jgi:transcriptional regulator with XRE-family HTH domain
VDDSLQRFAEVLREWRVTQRRKIADAAAEIGVSVATWGHWERGMRFPSAQNLVKLSSKTGIEIQHFFCPNAARCPFATQDPERKFAT